MKSVPRIAMLAVGVVIEIFSLFIAPSLPVINLAVPEAKLRASFELFGLGSKTYSSIVSFECSVNLTTESSKKVIPIRPTLVSTRSFC